MTLLLPIDAIGQQATVTPTGAQTAPSDPLPMPLLDAAATDYETGLAPVAREESRNDRRLMIDATRAAQREDWRAAIGALEAMAGRRGDSVAVWMQLAQAWTAYDPGNIRGLSSSYIAYHRARAGDERTRALLELGDAAFAHHARLAEDVRIAEIHIEKDENHEAAKDLPALVARADEMLSIARRIQSRIGRTLSEEDELARERLRLDETPGFYLIDRKNTANRDLPTVENRPLRWHGPVPSATICVPFSRPLQTDTDAVRKAMTLIDRGSGEPVALKSGDVSVAGTEVCLHGLTVDTSYTLHFDKTLRSIGDARLPLDINGRYGVEARWASTSFKTAALEPRLGFEGDDYVLRAGGYARLGAVSMESADLALYRIADRSLARNVALGQFGRGLDSREVTAFDKGVAELVWTGTHVFDTEPNRRALARIPLDDILDARRKAIADPDASRTVFGGTLTVDTIREEEPGIGLFALVIKSAKTSSGSTHQYFVRTEANDGQRANAAVLPTQWFVRTNIGLSFYETSEFLHVAARDLGTGAARSGLNVELISASNRLLQSVDTDKNGIATFRRAMTQGTGGLAMRMAVTHSGSDFAFLSADTPPLLLDGLGLSRHSIDAQYDLYLTPERGVYRPGGTIRATAILRDRIGRPVDNPPKIALRLEDADGPASAVQYLKATEWRAGGRRIDIDIPASAAVGTARLVARLVEEDGRSGDEIGSVRIAISFFQPDTVRVEKTAEPPLQAEITGAGDDRTLRITGGVRATYLYGAPLADGDGLPEAPANGLTGTIRARLISDGRYNGQPGQSCYRGFRFGNSARPASATLRTLETTRSTGQDEAPADGENGQGFLRIAAEIATPPLDRAPLKADVGVYLDDGAATQGRMMPTASVTVPRTGPMIGLHYADGQVRTLVLDPDDSAPETYIYYRIETEDIGYIWQKKNRIWQADATPLLNTLGLTRSGDIAVENESPVILGAGGDDGYSSLGGHEHVPPAPDEQGCQKPTDMLDVSGLLPGRYIVTAALDAGFSGQPDTDSTLATYRFEIGQAEGPRPERPETFSLRLAKGDVAIGDPILAHVEALSIKKGHILVAAVKEGRVLSWQDVDLGDVNDGPIRFETDPAKAAPGQTDIRDITQEDWRGGVHLFATAFRAQGAGRAPNAARSIAASYVRISGPRRSFKVAVIEPQAEVQTRPENGKMTFRIKATDLAPGEAAYAAIGLVDEGLWRLTGFVPENPDTHFFAKRSLALTVRDLYGRILDSTKSGGDGFIPSDGASGLVSGGELSFLTKEALRFENGIAEVTVDLKNFVGSASLFVIAWSEHEGEARTGYVRKTYRIQSDVIMSLVAPNRMVPGDRVNARLVLKSPTGEAFPGGELRLKTQVSRPGSNTDATDARKTTMVTLGADQVPVSLMLDAALLAGGGPSEIQIRAVLDHPSSPSPIAEKNWTVEVGPPPGESITFLSSLGTAETGKQLAIDMSNRKGSGGLALERITLNPLAPTSPLRTVAWESPRDFSSAAAEAVFGIADLIASQPPKAADGGLGTLIALRGEERALSSSRNKSYGRTTISKVWRAAATLDIALTLREMGRVDDADTIDIAVGELTSRVRQYDVPSFCRKELYFAAIVLARSDALDDALSMKLENCAGRDSRDAVAMGLLAAALSADGQSGSKEAVDKAIDLFANAPPKNLRNAAIAAAMIVENGIDSGQAVQFMRTATAPPADDMAELDHEAAAWLSRAYAGLAKMFDIDPLDLDTLGLDPKTLSALAQDDGTIRIDLANDDIPDRIAFANGGEMPIHAIGHYRLSPARLQRPGGKLAFITDLQRKDGTEYVSARTLTLREKGLFILETDTRLSQEEKVRAIIHVPPGIELIARPYSRRLANDLKLVGTIDEVIHEPGRTVLQLRADQEGMLKLAFAVTPVVDGTFTWPAVVLSSADTGTGWSAAFTVQVTPQGNAQ